MSQHARPHLETHSRKQGHSAVAGAAYRLGFRLYDRRTKKWHDYRRRKQGEEVVRALTVAPKGLPAWVTDPEELWNRAEEAEKRKDAQVVRDYRIPIPFGLTDQQAGDLAEDMARFIAKELHTAVSLGLHRDADIDALGNLKPKEKQGYHAHLYFPTRRLEELEDGESGSAWGLGAKLTRLSNKNSSGAFVEMLNERWALLSNRYTAISGLEADYDHRSYKRQELPIKPQPTLGQAAVAMERKGIFTRKGDELRNDIIIPWKAYEKAHAVVINEQQRRAAADRRRETQSGGEGVDDGGPELVRVGSDVPAQSPDPVKVAQALGWLPGRGEPSGVREEPPAPIKLPKEMENKPLVERFRYVVGEPDEDERKVFTSVLKLVRILAKILDGLDRLRAKLAKVLEERGRNRQVVHQLGRSLGEWRYMRSAAKKSLRAWEKRHGWRMRATRLAGLGKPEPWLGLRQEVKRHNEGVQHVKGVLAKTEEDSKRLEKMEAELEARQERETEKLAEALSDVRRMKPVAADALSAVFNEGERGWVATVTPKPFKGGPNTLDKNSGVDDRALMQDLNGKASRVHRKSMRTS